MQIDIEIVADSVRSHDNLLDQSTNAAHRFFLCLFIGKAFDELRHRGAIAFAHAWLDERRFELIPREFCLDGVAALDRGVEIGFHFGSLDGARADHVDQFVALGDDPGQFLFKVAALCPLLLARRTEFSRILLAEHIEQFRIEQIIA